MLLQGVLWAIGRIGALNNDTTGYAIPVVLQYLQSHNDIVRGYAVIALGSLGALGAVPLLKGMINDSSVVPCYIGGKIGTKTIEELAADAVSKIGAIA
jgi:HEAT repeat protein